jgi:hypothetical protein
MFMDMCDYHKMGSHNSKSTLPSTLPSMPAQIRVLFLDVNGVLNCSESEKAIEDTLLARLARIVKTTKCKIVVSSSFRLSLMHFNYLWSKLESVGISRSKHQLPAYKHTPNYRILERTDEIMSVIFDLQKDPRYTVTHWVAIDDKNLLSQGTEEHQILIRGHAIQTNTTVGLTESDVDNAIKCLGH